MSGAKVHVVLTVAEARALLSFGCEREVDAEADGHRHPQTMSAGDRALRKLAEAIDEAKS